MTIDGRGERRPDDTRPAGREVIADRRLARTRLCRKPLRRSGFRAGNAVPRRQCLPAAIETERSVVTTQISDLGRAQRRVRAVAPVSDRAAVTTVEPVPRIALTQQEACASLGCSEEFFVRAGPSTSSGCASDGKRASVKQGSTSWEPDLVGKPCPYAAGHSRNRSILPADFTSADARLVVWRPRRFPRCLGVLGIVRSRRCRAACLQGPRRPRRWE